jgi:hypothetical protein
MIPLGYFDMIKIKAITVVTIQKEQHKKACGPFGRRLLTRF